MIERVVERHYCDTHDAWFPARGGCLFCLYDAGIIPPFEDEPSERPQAPVLTP